MNAWPTVLLVTTLAVISPGADFAMVTRTSLIESRRAGLAVALGIGCGVLVHVGYTLLGLGVLLQQSPMGFTLLQWVGAAYLVWLGVQMLRQAGYHPALQAPATQPTGAASPHPAPALAPFWRLGLGTNALNPKTALFTISLFAQVAGPGVAMSTQLAYGLFIAAAHVLWFGVVAFFFSAPALQSRVHTLRPWIDRCLGCVLLGLGVMLLGLSLPPHAG